MSKKSRRVITVSKKSKTSVRICGVYVVLYCTWYQVPRSSLLVVRSLLFAAQNHRAVHKITNCTNRYSVSLSTEQPTSAHPFISPRCPRRLLFCSGAGAVSGESLLVVLRPLHRHQARRRLPRQCHLCTAPSTLHIMAEGHIMMEEEQSLLPNRSTTRSLLLANRSTTRSRLLPNRSTTRRRLVPSRSTTTQRLPPSRSTTTRLLLSSQIPWLEVPGVLVLLLQEFL